MVMSVPPEMWRMGDFSGGPPIYDPLTTRPNPNFDPARPASASNSLLIRSQFPGNQIPMERIDPVALQVLQKYVPLPNTDGAMGMSMGGSFNNYLDTRAQELKNDQSTVRLDHAWQTARSCSAATPSTRSGASRQRTCPASARTTTTRSRTSRPASSANSARLVHRDCGWAWPA